jgi:sugar phosphate isomerase/epimerase
LTTGIAPSRLSIETLGYPYEWIEDMVKSLGLSVCLDLGHLLIRGVDLRGYLERYLARTSIIHLHGVEDGRDHLGIDRLSGETLDLILSCLRHYQGSLSIEVFSFDDLRNSLEALEAKWPER